MSKFIKYIITFSLCVSIVLGNAITVLAADQTLNLEGYLYLPSGSKSTMELSVKNMPADSTAIQVDFLADKALQIEEITFPYGSVNNCYTYYNETEVGGKKKVSLYIISQKQNILPISLTVAKVQVPSTNESLLQRIVIDQVKVLDSELKENVYGGKLVIHKEGSSSGGGSSTSSGSDNDKKEEQKDPVAVKPEVSTSSRRDTTTVSMKVNASVDANGIGKANVTRDLLVQAADTAISKAEGKTKTEVGLQMVFPEKSDQKLSSMSVTLSKSGIGYLTGKQINSLKIESGLVTYTLDEKAMEAILSQAKGDITIGTEAVAGSKPTFDLTVMSQNSKITNFKPGTIKVSIPYTIKKGEASSNIVISSLSGKNKAPVMVVNSSYDSKKKVVTFTTDHFSKYAVTYKKLAVTSDAKSHKSKGAIEFMRVRELLINKSKTKTVPNQSITREEVAVALGKISGINVKSYKNTAFKDVPSSNPNAPYIVWANKTGIMKGTSKTSFKPASTVTRQELASILVKYAAYKKYDLPTVNKKVTFTDQSKITKSNISAVSKLQVAGIMKGTTTKKFEPTKKVTRADFSETIKSYIESTLYIGE